jgi:membrane protease YdiL (CAAX protease family)
MRVRYGTPMHETPPPAEVFPPNPPASPGALPSGRWRWWVHLLLIAGYPLSIGALTWRAHEHVPALSSDPRSLLIVCTFELGVFGIIFGTALLLSRASREDLRLRWRNGFRPVFLGIGYSIALRMAVAVIVMIIAAVLVITHAVSSQALQNFFEANQPDIESVVDVAAMKNNPLYFWLIVTFVSFVVAGFREELWRSAFLCGIQGVAPLRFGSRAGQIGAIALAAVVFGIGHLGMGLMAVGLTALLGFGLGVIMVLHRSIWPAVLAHGFFDATSLAVLPRLSELLEYLKRMLGH